jgi:hypothetical protein
MTSQKKVWNKHKITAIVIMLIAFAIIFAVYVETENPTINHPKSLEKTISNLITTQGVKAEVVQVDIHDNYLFATFKDDKYPNLMGIARFQRGFDLLWHPIEISYNNELSVAAYTYYVQNKVKPVIYGINTDSKIDHYEGKGINEDREHTFKNNISSSNFIDYYEDEFYVYELNFFDKAGNNITLELKTTADDSGPRGWGSTGWSKSGNWGSYFIIMCIAFVIASLFWIGDLRPIRYSKIREKQKEAPKGFKNKWRKLETSKKIAIFIAIITLLIAAAICLIPLSDYSSENDLTETIEKYTGDSNVTILKTETEPDGKYLIALYTTEKSYTSSIVIFKRGWNGLVVPLEYYKTTSICITSGRGGFNIGDEYYFIVTGVDCDPRAVSYEYSYEHDEIDRAPTVVYGSDISEPNFIHIYKMKNQYMHTPKIYDAAGNNIQPELEKKFEEDMPDDWDKVIGEGNKTDRGNTKSTVSIIIVIGFFFAWMYWISIPKEEE